MTGEEFCLELEQQVYASLDRIAVASAAHEPAPNIDIAAMLVGALKAEIEASEEAALWMSSTPEVDVKLALARQCGDEARHYRLIEDRLRQMGRDPSEIDPLADGYTPMFQFLEGLQTTVERLAAGQFTREGLAKVRNEVFIDYCRAQGDEETAKLYEDIIQPDEGYHHELGRRLLPKYADTPEKQRLAEQAAIKTLELADELQEIARLKRGMSRLPGC
jgi:1,2-phenylacetyl-CoA epoxidase catalytic subunit